MRKRTPRQKACLHAFRPLDTTKPDEAAAKQEGYRYLCVKCGTFLKIASGRLG